MRTYPFGQPPTTLGGDGVLRSSELVQVTVDLGYGRSSKLLDLIDSWADHVLRFLREAHPAFDAPALAWGVHDFVASLYIRDRVQQGIMAYSMDFDATLPPTVVISDEVFRSFTAQDDRGDLRLVFNDIPSEPWWWQRVPKAGPVLTELQEIVSRLR